MPVKGKREKKKFRKEKNRVFSVRQLPFAYVGAATGLNVPQGRKKRRVIDERKKKKEGGGAGADVDRAVAPLLFYSLSPRPDGWKRGGGGEKKKGP